MINIIDKKEILPLKKHAELCGLVFNNSTNIYFGKYLDNKLVGFCGLMILKNKAILKNGFVLNEYRLNGIYKELNDFRFNYLKGLNINLIELNATKKSLNYHLKNGAIIVKEYKNCTKLKYQFIWQGQ
jgi:hypothetical protein